jgi:hypothetical protein
MYYRADSILLLFLRYVSSSLISYFATRQLYYIHARISAKPVAIHLGHVCNQIQPWTHIQHRWKINVDPLLCWLNSISCCLSLILDIIIQKRFKSKCIQPKDVQFRQQSRRLIKNVDNRREWHTKKNKKKTKKIDKAKNFSLFYFGVFARSIQEKQNFDLSKRQFYLFINDIFFRIYMERWRAKIFCFPNERTI